MSKSLRPYQLKSGRLSSHGRLLQFLEGLPRDIRILDLGVAGGYLGAVLRERGFTHLTGVDYDPEMIELARPFYEAVVVQDLEREAWPLAESAFDVIICADVLEHLREPSVVLERVRRLVAPGGWVLVSMPNVAHWTVRLSVLFGVFRYAASGILDRSHVRFFTRASARRLLRDSGLAIRREDTTPLPIARWCDGSVWTPCWRAVEAFDWLLTRCRPTVFAYQFVFVCQAAGLNL